MLKKYVKITINGTNSYLKLHPPPKISSNHNLSNDSPRDPSPDSKTDEKSKNLFFREKWIGNERGRLNLYSLFTGENPSPLLFQIAEKYLWELYGHKPFFNETIYPNIARTLLNEIISIQQTFFKQKGTMIPFEELSFKEEDLHIIFYKMLRGTHPYNIKNKEGHPPFSLFFISKNEDLSIHFHYASNCLLKALFGEKGAAAIDAYERKEEKKKNKRLSLSPLKNKEDLSKLLRISPKNKKIELLSFS